MISDNVPYFCRRVTSDQIEALRVIMEKYISVKGPRICDIRWDHTWLYKIQARTFLGTCATNLHCFYDGMTG